MQNYNNFIISSSNTHTLEQVAHNSLKQYNLRRENKRQYDNQIFILRRHFCNVVKHECVLLIDSGTSGLV